MITGLGQIGHFSLGHTGYQINQVNPALHLKWNLHADTEYSEDISLHINSSDASEHIIVGGLCWK